jgi:hypothetical protein
MAAGGERVNDARRHVASARSLAATDVTLALAACHDACRKAITAHMTAAGYRVRSGDGAHRIVLAYADRELAGVLADEDRRAADRIRRDRAIAEYGEFAARQLTAEHVRWAAGVAERIVRAIAADLAKR